MKGVLGCTLAVILAVLCASFVSADGGTRPYPAAGTVGDVTATGGTLSSFVLKVPARWKSPATTLTVNVTSTTTYHVGDFAAGSSAVVTGAQAMVLLQGAPTGGVGTALDVQIVPPPGSAVAGTVQGVSDDATTGALTSFTLQSSDPGSHGAPPVTVTISVTPTTAYYLGDKVADSTAVVVGAKAKVLLTAPLSGGAGTAQVVSVVPPPNTVVCGTVQSLNADPTGGALLSFALQIPARGTSAGQTLTVNVTSGTQYFLGLNAADSTAVTVGAQAVVLIQGAPAGGVGTALIVEVIPPPKPVICGTVQDIVTDPTSGALTSFDVLTPAHGKTAAATVTIDVTTSTTYYNGLDKADSTAVTLGARVQVLLTGPLSGATGTAQTVEVIPPPNQVLCGNVQAVTDDPTTGALTSFTMVLPAKHMEPTRLVTIGVTPGTQYFLGHKTTDSSVVTAGAKAEVLIKGSLVSNAGTALIVCIQPKK